MIVGFEVGVGVGGDDYVLCVDGVEVLNVGYCECVVVDGDGVGVEGEMVGCG